MLIIFPLINAAVTPDSGSHSTVIEAALEIVAAAKTNPPKNKYFATKLKNALALIENFKQGTNNNPTSRYSKESDAVGEAAELLKPGVAISSSKKGKAAELLKLGVAKDIESPTDGKFALFFL